MRCGPAARHRRHLARRTSEVGSRATAWHPELRSAGRRRRFFDHPHRRKNSAGRLLTLGVDIDNNRYRLTFPVHQLSSWHWPCPGSHHFETGKFWKGFRSSESTELFYRPQRIVVTTRAGKRPSLSAAAMVRLVRMDKFPQRQFNRATLQKAMPQLLLPLHGRAGR